MDSGTSGDDGPHGTDGPDINEGQDYRAQQAAVQRRVEACWGYLRAALEKRFPENVRGTDRDRQDRLVRNQDHEAGERKLVSLYYFADSQQTWTSAEMHNFFRADMADLKAGEEGQTFEVWLNEWQETGLTVLDFEI